MNKICTDVKQSKKLIELGLSPETADMYYTVRRGILDPKVTEYSKFPDVRHEYIAFDHLDLFYPCWSLSAILELMPTPLGIEYDLVHDDDGYYIAFDSQFEKIHENFEGTNPLDAAYNATVWLIEQGYIKTERK